MKRHEIVDNAAAKEDAEEIRQQVTISTFRRLLPQVIASLSCSLMIMLSSLSFAFPALAIGSLLYSDAELTLDNDQASWLGSIVYICQPLGGIASGIIVEILGRRKFMLLLNVPFLAGFILLAVANTYTVLVLGIALLGITTGLVCAPISGYMGEMSQPEIRGILSASTAIFFYLGWLLEYLLGALTTWRKAIAICAGFPVISFIILALEPESPTWLVSKNRLKDAERALCWIRGWVKPEAIHEELENLVRYHSESKAQKRSFHNNILLKPQLQSCSATDEISYTNNDDEDIVETRKISRVGNVVAQFREIIKPPTLRPLVLLISLMFVTNWAGLTPIRPFMVHVCNEFQMPITAEWVMVISAGMGGLGSIALMLVVHSCGKRLTTLVCTGTMAILALLLGLYAYLQVNQDQPKESAYNWVPMVLFTAMFFINCMGGEVPWIILSEIFPFRTRGKAIGISVASSSVIMFLASKTYLDIEKTFRLHGAFWFYGCISVVGFVFLYFRLLETEGRTLEEIEIHFTKGEYPKNVKRTRQYS